MKDRLFPLISSIFLPILFVSVTQADLLCLKTTAKNAKGGKISITNSVITMNSNASCPKGYKLLIDSSKLTGASGPEGPAGLRGEMGPQGASGQDGQLRIYGDGSRGDLTVKDGELVILDSPNLQFNNISIESGGMLQIPSGATVRCLGQFQNSGDVIIQSGAQHASHLASPSEQVIPTTPSYFGNQAYTATSEVHETTGSSFPSIQGTAGNGAHGTIGGVLSYKARTAIMPFPLGGGAGGNSLGTGGEGGGFAAVLCQGAMINTNEIIANGQNAASTISSLIGGGGGGGGGIIVLASKSSISNSGTIEAFGGNGSPAASAIINGHATSWAPGGGGGGGIIHLLAPSISSTGLLDVSAGIAGASASAASYPSATIMTAIGGGGGGSCYGAGGNGGTTTGDTSTKGFVFSSAQSGGSGLTLQTLVDPTSLF